MSRSNKNNGRKKLFKSENETRCSSSSSSSNSEDGDATNRNAAAALDPRSSPYPAGTRVLGGAGAAAAALKGGSEAPTDLVYEYLTRDHRHRGGRQPSAAAAAVTAAVGADKIRTNLKIVRIRKFQSNESKVLLIVDVPPAVRQQQLEQQQKQQQPPPPPTMPPLSATQSAALGGGCAPVEATASLEMGSREIFELSDELAKKFDVDRETAKSFEWRSFSRPDDVIKLLLNDGAAKPVAGGHDEPLAHAGASRKSVGGERASACCASIREDEAAPNGEGCDDGGAAAAAAASSKPATKRKRVSEDRDAATELERDEDDDGGRRRAEAADEAKMPQRSRAARGLLGRQANVPDASGYRGSGQQPPSAVLRNGAATETSTVPTVNKYRDTMVDETWKILKNCATLRRENVDTLHVLVSTASVCVGQGT